LTFYFFNEIGYLIAVPSSAIGRVMVITLKKKNRADSFGVKSESHPESEEWVCLNCRSIQVIEQLMDVLGIDQWIEEAKSHNDDDCLIQLLSIRRDANAVIEDLGEH